MPEYTMLIGIFPCLWTEGQILNSGYVWGWRWGENTFWIETSLLKISHILSKKFYCYFVVLVVLVAKSCLTLWDSTDCSLPGSSVHEILHARIQERVAISSSGGSSWPRDPTRVSCFLHRQVDLLFRTFNFDLILNIQKNCIFNFKYTEWVGQGIFIYTLPRLYELFIYFFPFFVSLSRPFERKLETSMFFYPETLQCAFLKSTDMIITY